jgi:hypothetical protein
MRLAASAVALIASLSLTACQTASTFNGVRLQPAQGGGDTFCERNLLLCLAGGGLVAGGAALAASSGYSHHSYSSGTNTGTGTGGMPGSGGY